MDLHDDPSGFLDRWYEQHGLVLGELHADMIARASEIDFRFADQGKTRRITRSDTFLSTVLSSRERRQSKDSSLQARSSNGFSIVMSDGHGTDMRIKLYPTDKEGSRLEPVPYVTGAQPKSVQGVRQLSLEDEAGEVWVDDTWTPPPGFTVYVLWWPGDLGFGGAVLAAGWVPSKKPPVIYAIKELPEPVAEAPRTGVESLHLLGPSSAAPTGSASRIESAAQSRPRRRDGDFDDVAPGGDAARSGGDVPPSSS